MTVFYDITGKAVPIYDTAGNLVFGPRDTRPVEPPEGPLRNIITQASIMNYYRTPQQSGTNGTFAVTEHRVVVDVDQPVLVWRAGGRGTDVGGRFRVSVQVNGGASRPVLFGGEQSVHIAALAGGLPVIESDPAPIRARAGDTLTLTQWMDSDGGQGDLMPADLTGILPEDPGWSVGPWTAHPSLTPASGLGGWALRPSAVLAPSDRPSWLTWGDSNIQPPLSFVEQALRAQGDAFIKAGQGGAGVADPDSTSPGSGWGSMIGPYLPYGTHFIDQSGGNAAGAGGWEVVAPQYLKMWAALRDGGIEHIIKTTITLAASTSNNWADLAGQELMYHGLNRRDVSDWLKDGAPYIGGVAVAPGTPGATRCRVVRDDGTVAPGTGDHLLAGVSDIRPPIEDDNEVGKYNAAARAVLAATNHRDGLHPPVGVHALCAERLIRDLALLGY